MRSSLVLGIVLLLGSLPLLAQVPEAAAAAPRQSGTEYHVDTGGADSNDGSSGSPWENITYAVGQLVAGDTLVLHAGTYAYTSSIYLTASGTPSEPITIRAQGEVIINGSQLGGVAWDERDILFLDGVEYVVVDGLVLEDAARAGMRISLSNNVTVRNVTARNNYRWGIFTDFAYDLLVENNSLSGSMDEHGIYLSNSGDGHIVRNNTIFGNFANGIHLNGDLSAGGDGLITNVLVENNVIYDNGVGGGSGVNCDGVQNSTIRNNLIYDGHASGISLYRIDGAFPSNGNEVYHNTIHQASDGRWALNLQHGSSQNKLYNNILLTEHSWRGSISLDSTTGLESDHNIFTTNTNAVTPDDDSSYLTLPQWQGLGFDLNSVAADRVDVLDIQTFELIMDSVAIDNATSSYTTPADIRDLARPQGTAPDTTPPQITASDPQRTAITLTFSETMNRTSLEMLSSYEIRPTVAITASFSHDTGVVLQTANHSTNTSYTLNITGLQDLAGNTILPTDVTYLFPDPGPAANNNTTQDGNDTIPETNDDEPTTRTSGVLLGAVIGQAAIIILLLALVILLLRKRA